MLLSRFRRVLLSCCFVLFCVYTHAHTASEPSVNCAQFTAEGERFYAAVSRVWTSHKKRAQVALNFAQNKATYDYWQRTAWMSAIASFDMLDQRDSVRKTVEEAIQAMPNNDFVRVYGSWYWLYYDLPVDSAARWMSGVDATVPAYWPHECFSEERWSLETHGLWVDIRSVQALVHALKGDVRSAEELLSEVFDKEMNPLTLDDYKTEMIAHYVDGMASMSQDTVGALQAFARALNQGETRDRLGTKLRPMFHEIFNAKYGAQLDTTTSLDEKKRGVLAHHGSFFSDVTDSVGFTTSLRRSHVAWGFWNSDSLADLLIDGRALYVAKTDGTFELVAQKLSTDKGRSGLFCDFDNDGDMDIFYIGRERHGLIRNNNGMLSDETIEMGEFASEAAACIDLNADGYPEVYQGGYEKWNNATMSSVYFGDLLWENTKGVLTPTKNLPVESLMSVPTRGVVVDDLDGDGDQDILVSSYRLKPNVALLNNNGVLEADATSPLIGVRQQGSYGHSAGADIGDLNNDGRVDVSIANVAHPRYIDFSNRTGLYVQDTLGKFVESRKDLGIRFEETHAQAGMFDYNGDGLQDLFMTSMYEFRRSFLYEQQASDADSPYPFRDVAGLTGTMTFDGYAWAPADYDMDGDLDLIVGSGDVYRSGIKLLRNELQQSQQESANYLHIRVKAENQFGFGCIVTAKQGDRTQRQRIDGGFGICAQRPPTAYFAFGNNLEPVEITVTTPSGSVHTQVVHTLNAYVVVEVE